MKRSFGTLRGALEMGVAVAALVTSATSIWLSLRQGDDMARLVQAQSWPYLEYETSNTNDNGQAEIDIRLRNAGVGPAKVKSFSVTYEGKPMRGWAALVKACCAPDGKPIDSTEALLRATDGKTLTSQVLNHVMRASDTVSLLRVTKNEANSELWTKLDKARFELKLRACYCSVFDECWVSDLRGVEQTAVASCPVEPTPYVE